MGERLSHDLRRTIRERQDFRCALCGEEHPPGSGGCISVHHIKPRFRKGSDDPGNLVGLCRGEGTNECHNKVDYLTIEHGVAFQQIMTEGVEYLLQQYPNPRFTAQESDFFDEPNPEQNMPRQNHARRKRGE